MEDYRRITVTQMSGPHGKITVARMIDKLVTTEDAVQEFGRDLDRLIDGDGHRNIILHLGAVELMGSRCLNSILGMSQRLGDLGGKMVICNLTPAVRGVFESTKLDRVLELKADETEALASM